MTGTNTAHYKIIHIRHGELIEVNVEEVPREFSDLQPMGVDTYLIAGLRAPEGFPNAWIVDNQGRAIEKFRIGDAIESMQATAGGIICVVYYDEGVFGYDR